jgi:uncharacterized membrane protein YidH (DUF202 family)
MEMIIKKCRVVFLLDEPGKDLTGQILKDIVNLLAAERTFSGWLRTGLAALGGRELLSLTARFTRGWRI